MEVKKSNIPSSYLFRLYFGRLLSLIYGCMRMRRLSKIFIHPTAVIKCTSRLILSCGVTISRHSYIDALSQNGLAIGKNVFIGRCSTIECSGSLETIGKGIKIGNNVSLGTHGYYGGAGGVEIGDFTIFGNYVSIHPENHNYSNKTLPISMQGVNQKGIVIGSGCWIGAKVTILDGTTIGNNVVVAAGAVVTGRFPNNVVIGGVPAKILKLI